jgi:hypothetical protein
VLQCVGSLTFWQVGYIIFVSLSLLLVMNGNLIMYKYL